MGQTNSVAEKKEDQVNKIKVSSNAEILSDQTFDKLMKSRQEQLQQQLQLLDKANQEIPTSSVQTQDLINISRHYYEPVKRPDLRNFRYKADGTFN